MKAHILLVAILSLTASCKKSGDTENSRAEFPVTRVHTMDVETDLFFVADIQAVRNVEIRARVNGYLEQVLADEGKDVKGGQLLFKIDDEEYHAQYSRAVANRLSAEAKKKSAEVELERVRRLVAKNVIATTELDLAQANLDVATAAIEQAKAEEAASNVKLTQTNVRSPFDGVIDRLPLKLGSLVTEGTLLTTISDASSVFAYFQVSETQFLTYLKSNRNALDTLFKINVELVLADGSVYPSKGKIETVESEFDVGTGALAVRARFGNPDGLLRHGSTGRIKIRRRIREAVLVPQKSVVEIQDRNYVFTIDGQGVAMMKSFVPLGRFQDFYLVKSGLSVGDRIVYEGVQNLREGVVITSKETSEADVYTTSKN